MNLMNHTIRLLVALAMATSAIAKDVRDVDIHKAHAVGTLAAARLVRALAEELQQALKSGDPAQGMQVCADAAQAIGASATEELPGVLSVRRTSTRCRNPVNEPGENARIQLDRFQAEVEKAKAGKGTSPGPQTEVLESGGETTLVYYQPIIVNPLCLKCHGNPNDISPETRSLLNKLYPNDTAVGYQSGDLRGLIEVVISLEAIQSPTGAVTPRP